MVMYTLKLMTIHHHPVLKDRNSSVYFWPQTPLTPSTINIKEPSRSNGLVGILPPSSRPPYSVTWLVSGGSCLSPDSALALNNAFISQTAFQTWSSPCFKNSVIHTEQVPYTSDSDAYTPLPAYLSCRTYCLSGRVILELFHGVFQVSSGSQGYLETCHPWCFLITLSGVLTDYRDGWETRSRGKRIKTVKGSRSSSVTK